MSTATRNLFPQLRRHSTPTESGSTVVSYSSDLGPDTPVLTLIHGYPQSSYIWRYVVPQLLDKVSLFVPELPGYGISTPAVDNSRLAIGRALIETLVHVLGISEVSRRTLILGGHDRGARLCHRLAVTGIHGSGLDLVGAILMDIVPTKVQWEKFSDPQISCNYFHWPLLANVPIAVALLKAYGGGEFVRSMSTRIAGTEAGKKRMLAGGGVDLHAKLFDSEDTLRYSSEDYAAGAAPECDDQTKDQEAGRKIEVPTMVLFSEAKLGSRIDVSHEWRNWIKEGTPFEPVPVGEGHGHYLPEEAHEIVSERILSFVAKYCRKS